MIQIEKLHKSYIIDLNPLHVLKGFELSGVLGEWLHIMESPVSRKSTLLNVEGILDNYLFKGW